MASSYVGLQAALNVKDFGAIGDGSTNDTAAIQGAINALPGPGSGGTIYFPPGTYVCTSTIDLRAGVHLVGSGWGSTIIRCSGAAPGIRCSQGSLSYANISIRDIQIDGTAGASSTVDVLSFTNCIGVSIVRCYISNGDYCIAMNTCQHVVIENCECIAPDDYGIYLTACSIVAITATKVSQAAGTYAILISGSSSMVTVTSCYFSGNSAVATLAHLAGVTGVSFIGCRFDGATGAIVTTSTAASSGVLFESCYFSTSGNVTYIDMGSTGLGHLGITVKGCYFDSLSGSKSCFGPGSATFNYLFVDNIVNTTPAAFVTGIGSTTTRAVWRDSDKFQFDDEVQLRASGVAHGITGVEPTDIFGRFKPISTADGGLDVVGLTEQGRALNLFGFATTEDTASDAAARGNIELDAYLKSGTGGTTHGTTANLVVIRNGGSTRFIFKGNGDSYSDGSGWTNYDSHDDVALLTGLCVVAAPSTDPLRRQFLAFVDEHKARLRALGLVEVSADGRIFVNHTRVEMLLAGAVRQIAQRLTALETSRTRVRGWRAILSSVVRRASRNT